MKLEIRYVNIKAISPNPWNPHSTTPDELDELIESIGTKGVVDTPTVVVWDRPVRYEELTIEPKTEYMLIDGEQRFTAAREAFMRGMLTQPVIPVTVLGNLTDFDEVYLAELGEALNGRGRGSQEDVKKTGIIAKWLTQNRSVEEAARLMGKKREFIAKSLAAVTMPEATPDAPVPLPKTERPAIAKERKSLNIVLPFEDELAVEEFENLLAYVDTEGHYPTRGHRRTAQVMEALRAYRMAGLEE